MFHYTFLITRRVEILKAATAKMFFPRLVANFSKQNQFQKYILNLSSVLNWLLDDCGVKMERK